MAYWSDRVLERPRFACGGRFLGQATACAVWNRSFRVRGRAWRYAVPPVSGSMADRKRWRNESAIYSLNPSSDGTFTAMIDRAADEGDTWVGSSKFVSRVYRWARYSCSVGSKARWQVGSSGHGGSGDQGSRDRDGLRKRLDDQVHRSTTRFTTMWQRRTMPRLDTFDRPITRVD